MADDTTAPDPDVPATDTPDPGDEQLGEAGLKALQRERDARRALEQQIKALEPLAAKAHELEEAQKTEQQRLTDRAAAAETERDQIRVELIRLRMATRYGLAEDDVDLLGAGTGEEIEARAKRLAERFGVTTPAVPGKPTPAMRPVTTVAGEPKPVDGNEWFRRFATESH